MIIGHECLSQFFNLSSEMPGLLGRLCLAALLGAVVGLERDIRGRAAGLRTHLLVSLGAALFTILSTLVAASSQTVPGGADAGRIAAQIVTGVGFLGAGVIMKEGFSVRGITTAACFWIVAAIGMAAGIGQSFLAISTCFITLVALSTLHRVDKFYKRDSYRILTLTLSDDVSIKRVIDSIKRKHVTILFVDFDRDYESKTTKIILTMRLFHRTTTDKIAQIVFRSLEDAGIPLKTASWRHGKAT